MRRYDPEVLQLAIEVNQSWLKLDWFEISRSHKGLLVTSLAEACLVFQAIRHVGHYMRYC